MNARPASLGIGLYCVLAFIITWSLTIPLIASHQGWWGTEVSPYWHAIGAAGPLVAAILAAHRFNTLDGLVRGWRNWRFGRWLWLAALSPLVLAAPAAVIAYATSGHWPDIGTLAASDLGTTTALVMGVMLPAVAYGIGEETGWRGFLLPRLQTLSRPWMATLTLSMIWVAWHIPFYLYRAGFVETSTAEKVFQGVVILINAYFITWLFNSTGGSIAAAATWHTLHSIIHIIGPRVSNEWTTWNGVLTTLLAVVVMIVWRKRLAIGDPVRVGSTAQAQEGDRIAR